MLANRHSESLAHATFREITIEHDRVLLETMWKETWKVWFPMGIADPKIAVLKFTASVFIGCARM